MEESSAELLERYRIGDPQAAAVLFARYVERLTEMVRWHITPALQKRLDPEDPVHSAYRSFFVRARQGKFVLEHSGDLWKLLVTITLNKLRRQIAHHRAQKRAANKDRHLSEASLRGIDIAAGPSPLEALAAADELEAFMVKLSPLQRHVLELRLQERRWDEIALATGRSERTVRRALEEVRLVWQREADKGLPLRRPSELLQSKSAGLPLPVSQVGRDKELDPDVTLDYRDFVLQELIGSGGMGKVYRAWWKSRARPVAVKMLRKSYWTVTGAVERFLAEARVVRHLRHPGIVGVEGVGTTPSGGLFIVMEFIEGSNLAEKTAENLPSPHQAAAWIAEAAAALDYAHQQGIVHCDLKPSNLLLENSGRILVTDFGLATALTKLPGPRKWAGTLGFMAPEQLDDDFGEISPATDIFALGLVLHRLISGRMIFDGERILDALKNRIQDDGDWLKIHQERQIPKVLADVLTKCLMLEPSSRIGSASVLALLLRKFCEQV